MRGPGVATLLKDVFDLFTRLLKIALGLIGFTLSLKFVVTGCLPEGLLALALRLFGLILGLVIKTQEILL